MDELEELYFKLPKESFELILRNVSIRENLFNAWKSFLNSDFESVEEITSSVFDEMFEIFFKHFKLFGVEEKNLFDDFLKSYTEFTSSMLKLWFSFLEVKDRSLVEEFLERWVASKEKFVELLKFELIRNLRELPFMSKDAVIAVYKAIESYEKFSTLWGKYRKTISETWNNAVRIFVDNLKTVETPENVSFNDFVSMLMKELSLAFDKLMKSEDFVRLQAEMNHNLMDFLKYGRVFNESLANNPLNPFALKSEIDEAYRRIHDLKREVNRLNKKLEELEKKFDRRAIQ